MSLLESYSRPGSGLQRFEVQALGTRNVLLLDCGDTRLAGSVAQEAFDLLSSLERLLSKFLPESDVSLVNSLAASQDVFVGEELLHLLERSREAWELTGGAFDPTVGALLRAWGLVDMEPRSPPPEEIERLLEDHGMDRVLVDTTTGAVRFTRPGVSLDLGAIGKGYAVDRVVAAVRQRGIESGAFVSGRSSLVTWGAPPGGECWRVEIVHPERPEEGICLWDVEPGAVSSSGSYERFVQVGSRVHGHIIDPRTGYPVEAVKGATVWTRSALLGDVLSTTLFLLGREALAPDGSAESLVRAWCPQDDARAAVLLLEADPTTWGGIREHAWSYGEPPVRQASSL